MNEKLKDKYTEDFITACEEGIYREKILQGIHFAPNVYIVYDKNLNGFFMYEMKKNIGLVGMLDSDGHIMPWTVTYSTAFQKYAVLTIDEIPES